MGPTMKFFALILAILSVFVLTGMSECGTCPDHYVFAMQSGSYSHISTDILREPPAEAPLFPHLGATNLRLNVDVDSKTAVLEYQKDGKTVVETWRW